MEEDLRAHLLADAGTAAVAGIRVDWDLRPQGDGLPAVVLQLITAPGDYTYAGSSGLVGASVQIDCWGRDKAASTLLARAVMPAMERISGLTVGATKFQGAFLTDRASAAEKDEVGPLHRTRLDYRVWHHQTAEE